jgi:hypothetical protein
MEKDKEAKREIERKQRINYHKEDMRVERWK